MRPITAKGGITGTDLPRVRGKVKEKDTETVSVRFKLTKSDMKAIAKLASTLGMTLPQFAKLKLRQAVNPELRVE